MDFKVDNGPWETVFVGMAYGHEVEIVSNPEKFFLVFIYDQEGKKKIGAAVEGYKALVAKGPMEAFIQTLPKPCLGVEKTIGDKTHKLFFLSFDPMYLDFRQEDYIRKLDKQIQKSYDAISTMMDLARTSSLELKEPAMSPELDYATIIGDPFVSRILIGGARDNDLTRIDLAQKEEGKEAIIQIGLGKGREIMRETSDDLYRTLIIGQNQDAVSYALYIVTENFLLEDAEAIIFDSDDYFTGIGVSSKNDLELKDALVDFEPIGFPVKKFEAKKEIKIALKDTDLLLITGLLGVHDPDMEKNLALASFVLQANTPPELAEQVLGTAELGDFQKLKAERILNIVNQRFPKLFGQGIPPEELTKKWPGNLGRATIIDTKSLSLAERIIFTQTTLRLISKSLKERVKDRFVVVIPNGGDVLAPNPEKFGNTILRLENMGVGFALGAGDRISDDIMNTMNTTIYVVKEKDVAVSIKNKRNYRAFLRPSLSGNPKAE